MAKEFEVFASHMANCIRLAGNKNLSRGILLYRIYCRSKKSKMKDRNGVEGWAVLTPKEWTKDTGLSESQYYTAVDFLKKNNFLIYKNQYKGKHTGGAPLWAKLSEEMIAIIEDPHLRSYEWITSAATSGVGVITSAATSPIYKSVNSKSVKLKSVTETSSGLENFDKFNKEDSREDVYESNVINIKDGKMKKGAGRSKEVLNKKNHGMSMEDTAADINTRVFKTDILHVTSFSFHWAELYTEYFDYVERGPWTRKEMGYASSIIDKCQQRRGDEAGKYLAKIITDMFQNWKDYSEFAAVQDGLPVPLYSPSIGALASGFQTLTVWHGIFMQEGVHVHARNTDVIIKQEKIKYTGDKD